MSVAKIKFEDGKIVGGIDANNDGENSIGLSLSVSEAIEEGMAALKKGEASTVTVDVKSVTYSFKDGKVSLSVDTDKDGEPLLEAFVDMAESFEEISSELIK